MIRGVILDSDGTIVSLGKNYSYISRFHEEKTGILSTLSGRDHSGLTSSQTYDLIRLHNKDSVRMLNGFGIYDSDSYWSALERRDLEIRKGMIGSDIFAYDDALHLLKELSELGMRTGILSNTPEPIIRMQLRELGLSRYFDNVVCFRYNEPRSKPSPWGIEYMLDEWGLEKDDACIFGDGDIDIHAGRAAGILTGQLMRPGHYHHKNTNPHITGDDLQELWRKANAMQMRR